ncbi:hypothetical protein YC2023_079523 [Brassica napus]
MSIPKLIVGACVWSHSDNDDHVEELTRRSAQKNIAAKFNASMLRNQLQYVITTTPAS